MPHFWPVLPEVGISSVIPFVPRGKRFFPQQKKAIAKDGHQKLSPEFFNRGLSTEYCFYSTLTGFNPTGTTPPEIVCTAPAISVHVEYPPAG